MRKLPQWINWREEPRPGQTKPAKVPCAGPARIDPHDRSHWLPFEITQALDAGHVGFVLTEDDPYFCIDLDHAWDGDQWSPLAQEICARFAGAYVEVSHSGDGLHIMGQGKPPEGYGAEIAGGPSALYVSKRFIAITGRHATGDIDSDHTAALAWLAATHLKPRDTDGPAGDWTTGPVADSTPIEDDTTLIQRMLSAKASAGVAFGGKASASDLWYAVEEALADAWPSTTPGEPYDRSSADAALAGHLAFWTGKDCARIDRLMRMSRLVRPKWDRSDYLPRTITGAVARCSRVYNVPAVGGPESRVGMQFMTVEQQVEYFAGCVYIIGAHRMWTPRGDLLKPEQFNAAYGGYEFQIAYDSARPSKKAFETFTESRAARFPKADALCFRPEHAPGSIITENGRTMVNTYIPANVTVTHDDVTPFLDLLRRLLPDEHDRTILTCYLAALRQYPGVKFQWAPLIQGMEGNGKGCVMACAEYAVGAQYTHMPSAKELGDSGAKFTGWLVRKLLIIVEEIYVSDRREVIDSLKPLITNRKVEIQAKGADQITGDNRANFILTSNHRDAIVKTRSDRRYCVFYTAQQDDGDLQRDGMDGAYFPTLWKWLDNGGYAAVAGYLQRYTIPDELNPATLCHRAPVTSSTEAAIVESRGIVEQEILQAIDEGRQGFAGGWVSSIALTKLLQDIRRQIAPRKRGALMRSLGYVPHPALINGQCNTPVMQEEMKRPYLYVAENSIQARNITDSAEVLRAYMKAQGYAEAVSRAGGI